MCPCPGTPSCVTTQHSLLSQFPAELEPSALRIVHHSAHALPDLVNDVYEAHRPLPAPSEPGVANGAPPAKHPLSKPSIEVWILQVRIPASSRGPWGRAAASLEHGTDGQKWRGGLHGRCQSARMASLMALLLPEDLAAMHASAKCRRPAPHVLRSPCAQVASQETHGSGHMLWIARPDLIARYGLPADVPWELSERLFSLPVLKSKRAPAGAPITPALCSAPPPFRRFAPCAPVVSAMINLPAVSSARRSRAPLWTAGGVSSRSSSRRGGWSAGAAARDDYVYDEPEEDDYLAAAAAMSDGSDDFDGQDAAGGARRATHPGILSRPRTMQVSNLPVAVSAPIPRVLHAQRRLQNMVENRSTLDCRHHCRPAL